MRCWVRDHIPGFLVLGLSHFMHFLISWL
jgi:hypothetical protein